ncbi:MAG: MlaD family protein [Pseudomonas marincola]
MNNAEEPQAHAPVVRRGYTGLMSIWLIPLIAICIAGWLIIQSVLDKGPEISISLASAKGLEAGKTALKYKDVVIGVVARIEIPDEREGIDVIVSINKEASKYLTETARFWVVSPAISLEGVSGLETLLSGAYLEIDPGNGGDTAYTFKGLEVPPVITSKTSGKEYIVRSDRLGNIKRGTPVIYKGLQVGKILGYRLADDQKTVELITFIEAPHTDLIFEGTRFWNAGSVSINVSATGVEMGASSLAALLSGAIEFLPPARTQNSALASEGHEFHLYGGRNAMDEARFTERLPYLLYFDGSVSGLEVGAPVEFKGIKIGSVRDITLEIEQDTGNYYIPVLIEIEPQRIAVQDYGTNSGSAPIKQNVLRQRALESLINRGLRARLKSKNFLTGQLIVDLDLFPNKPAIFVSRNTDYQELPTLPTELEEITTSLTRLVEKIEKLPIEKLANSLIRTAEGLEGIISEGQLIETIGEYRDLAKSVSSMIDQVNKETLPRISDAVDEGKGALKRVDETLESATKLFATADAALSDGSPLKYDLTIMMRELSAASRSVRNLAEFLERNPSALLGGKK